MPNIGIICIDHVDKFHLIWQENRDRHSYELVDAWTLCSGLGLAFVFLDVGLPSREGWGEGVYNNNNNNNNDGLL